MGGEQKIDQSRRAEVGGGGLRWLARVVPPEGEAAAAAKKANQFTKEQGNQLGPTFSGTLLDPFFAQNESAPGGRLFFSRLNPFQSRSFHFRS